LFVDNIEITELFDRYADPLEILDAANEASTCQAFSPPSDFHDSHARA